MKKIKAFCSWDGCEETFKTVLNNLRQEGFTMGIFKDIDLTQHREWVERVCTDCGITLILPLWNRKREEIRDNHWFVSLDHLISQEDL
jgi:diphthine-ammonia ligase